MFSPTSMSNADADFTFEKGFGKMGIAPEETYYDPMRGVDKRTSMAKKLGYTTLTKGPSIGATSGGTSTMYSLMPPFLDPSIVDQTVRQTPLVKLLPRKAIRGRSYIYNLISAKGGAKWLPDDSPLSDQVDTRDDANVAMKYLYAIGRVTGPALASGEGYINLLAEDIRVKTASMNEALENEIINGNTSTDANGFNGFIQTISTNTTNNSSTYVTLAQMRADLATAFNANGMTNLIVTDMGTANYIKGLLMDYQRFVEYPREDMSFGIPGMFLFDGVPVVADRYSPTTSNSRRIFYLDTRYVFLAVLQDYTFEELAKTNDSSKYMIKFYGSLVMSFEGSCVMRYGIT